MLYMIFSISVTTEHSPLRHLVLTDLLIAETTQLSQCSCGQADNTNKTETWPRWMLVMVIKLISDKLLWTQVLKPLSYIQHLWWRSRTNLWLQTIEFEKNCTEWVHVSYYFYIIFIKRNRKDLISSNLRFGLVICGTIIFCCNLLELEQV